MEGLDRRPRNQVEQERTVRRLEHRGIRIIGVTDGYDSESAGRKIHRTMRWLINEIYLDDLRHKTHRGLARQLARRPRRWPVVWLPQRSNRRDPQAGDRRGEGHARALKLSAIRGRLELPVDRSRPQRTQHQVRPRLTWAVSALNSSQRRDSACCATSCTSATRCENAANGEPRQRQAHAGNVARGGTDRAAQPKRRAVGRRAGAHGAAGWPKQQRRPAPSCAVRWASAFVACAAAPSWLPATRKAADWLRDQCDSHDGTPHNQQDRLQYLTPSVPWESTCTTTVHNIAHPQPPTCAQCCQRAAKIPGAQGRTR